MPTRTRKYLLSVKNITKDRDALTMTVESEFDAPIERVWQLWADPRQLERWWGPPTYPATVVEHDLSAGSTVTYYMTGPDGERSHGWSRIIAVDPPTSLQFEDGFADSEGTASSDLPTTTARVTLAERPGGGTSMVIASTFPTATAMDQMIEMGLEEGIASALGQIDALLAA